MRRKCQGFSDELESVLMHDNKARFVKLIKDHPAEITKSLVEKCADSGAKKCLLALLNGELCDPPPALDTQLPESGVTALASVCHCCPDPQIVDLMLKRCNAIPLVNVNCTIGLVDGYPIHFVLFRLSYLEHLYYWSQGDSLIKLLILLCQWKTKPLLDSVRLLAQHTYSINDIAWSFVSYGGLKQFGALLLVAREGVMAPFDTGFTIREYLTIKINSYGIDHEDECKNMLIDARKLLDVFEKAGDDLSLYCSSMEKYVAIGDGVRDVCKLFTKAKVEVNFNDLKLGSLFHGVRGYGSLMRALRMKLPGPDDSRFLSVAPAGKMTPQYFYGELPSLRNVSSPKNLISSASQPRSISTTACQVRKISKPLEHTYMKPLFKCLGFMTVSLKKGLKFN